MPIPELPTGAVTMSLLKKGRKNAAEYSLPLPWRSRHFVSVNSPPSKNTGDGCYEVAADLCRLKRQALRRWYGDMVSAKRRGLIDKRTPWPTAITAGLAAS